MSFFLLLLTLTFFSPLLTNAHNCTHEFSTEIKNKFQSTPYCLKKTQGAEFGWVFDNKTRQLDIAFGAKLGSETGWLAWGLNPHGPHMIGTRALIGIKHSNDSLEWHQYNITEGTRHGCPLSPSDDVGLNVTRFKLEYMEKIEYYVILAAIFLPHVYNSSATNVVWQIGEQASESQPLMHPKSLDNYNSAETLNLVNGNIASFTAHQRRRLRLVHGIMNIVGWGTLLPAGVIVARYFNKYPMQLERSFIFHATCQTVGYIIGSLGWALGIWLGITSKYYSFHTHYVLGIIIFTFTTIQMLALRLRLHKNDKHRMYWNMYHHFLGYILLVLIWVNIFVGIRILKPGRDWKWGYVGVLGFSGLVALAFELFSWIKFLIQNNKCT
ncbi:hypothetical protein ACS0TY_016682 [Phlomoides rotata]